MNDTLTQPETTSTLNSAQTSERLRKANSLERTRRFRARRRDGILIVTVEVPPDVTEYLAAGTRTPLDHLVADRHLLASSVRRALRHGAKRWREEANKSGQ